MAIFAMVTPLDNTPCHREQGLILKQETMGVVTATLLIAIVATLLLVHFDGPAME